MDLNELSKEIFAINKEKGFWDSHFKALELTDDPELKKAIDDAFVSQKLMLITTEVGEAMEALRDGKLCQLDSDELTYLDNTKDDLYKDEFQARVKNTLQDEIADSIIRLLDLSGGLDINIEKHILMKIKYNKTRGYKHGKQF